MVLFPFPPLTCSTRDQQEEQGEEQEQDPHGWPVYQDFRGLPSGHTKGSSHDRTQKCYKLQRDYHKWPVPNIGSQICTFRISWEQLGKCWLFGHFPLSYSVWILHGFSRDFLKGYAGQVMPDSCTCSQIRIQRLVENKQNIYPWKLCSLRPFAPNTSVLSRNTCFWWERAKGGRRQIFKCSYQMKSVAAAFILTLLPLLLHETEFTCQVVLILTLNTKTIVKEEWWTDLGSGVEGNSCPWICPWWRRLLPITMVSRTIEWFGMKAFLIAT